MADQTVIVLNVGPHVVAAACEVGRDGAPSSRRQAVAVVLCRGVAFDARSTGGRKTGIVRVASGTRLTIVVRRSAPVVPVVGGCGVANLANAIISCEIAVIEAVRSGARGENDRR